MHARLIRYGSPPRPFPLAFIALFTLNSPLLRSPVGTRFVLQPRLQGFSLFPKGKSPGDEVGRFLISIIHFLPFRESASRLSPEDLFESMPCFISTVVFRLFSFRHLWLYRVIAHLTL